MIHVKGTMISRVMSFDSGMWWHPFETFSREAKIKTTFLGVQILISIHKLCSLLFAEPRHGCVAAGDERHSHVRWPSVRTGRTPAKDASLWYMRKYTPTKLTF